MILERISNILKSKNITFNLNHSSTLAYHIFDFPIDSTIGFIEVDFEYESVLITMFYDLSDTYFKQIELKSEKDFDDSLFNILFDEYLEGVQKELTTIKKIGEKVTEIVKLAESANMNYESFITINFDFQ